MLPRALMLREAIYMSKERGLLADLQVVLPLVVKGEALCCALALVVAAALADAVHIAPVAFCLRVLQRVPIHLKSKPRASQHICAGSSPQAHTQERQAAHASGTRKKLSQHGKEAGAVLAERLPRWCW